MRVKESLILALVLIVLSITGLNAQAAKTYVVSGTVKDASCACTPYTPPTSVTLRIFNNTQSLTTTVPVDLTTGFYSTTVVSLNNLPNVEVTYHEKKVGTTFVQISTNIFTANVDVNCQHKIYHREFD